MNEQLAKNPNDPKGLFARGELRLDKGSCIGAVEDLRASLANNPPEDLKTKAETKLFDAMTELLQRDFNSGEKYLKEYGSCAPSPGETPPRRRSGARRTTCSLVAKGREDQGEFVEALKAYLEFGSLPTAQDELLGVVTEPAVKARPDVWAARPHQGHAGAGHPDAAQAAGRRISPEVARGQDQRRHDRVRHFVNMFGDIAGIGKEGRLFLAERLMEQSTACQRRDEFLKVLNDEDPVSSAGLDGLARLMTRKGELEDAYHYYQVLKIALPRPRWCDDGKTGTQLFDELATDKRFLMYMDEPGANVGIPRFEGSLDDRGSFPQTQQYQGYTFEPLNKPLPSLKRMRCSINGNYLKLVDRRNEKARPGPASRSREHPTVPQHADESEHGLRALQSQPAAGGQSLRLSLGRPSDRGQHGDVVVWRRCLADAAQSCGKQHAGRLFARRRQA